MKKTEKTEKEQRKNRMEQTFRRKILFKMLRGSSEERMRSRKRLKKCKGRNKVLGENLNQLNI